MFAEFGCGRCESRFQIDAEDNDDSVWSLIWRFANAHTTNTCGMLTSGEAQVVLPPDIKQVPRPRKARDDDEEATL